MNIDKQALRKVAEKAQAARARLESFPDEDGVLFEDDDIKSDVSACNKFFVLATPATMLALLDELEAETRYREGAFIACNRWHDKFREADDKLEAAERRIEELERSETQLINERDSAESALNDAYKAVMGQAPEWSNWFSFENAIDEIELVCELWRNQTDDVIQFRQRIQELEAKLETADKLQDSAFRYGLKAGFSYGQTDDQSGFTQCMSAYSNAGIKVKES
ncbi:ead/Ea22-like family protein [Salmonella enterica subsp. enterica serovar Bareilly]|uniref:Ead/Ea22-like family protein n=1 Tax=Salmonella enterica subsp. enterica serovar Bareilly TaxID=58096 RepID=A0A5U9SUJ4_SALET|nr:ead/Ea22-like family protein [Salmonella enterica subsp. enterica serovar Bareilly]EDQ2671380.1 ead/Ea22-like family protein [Salmonella enterica subsp. enterica serovar Saintpaul]